MAKKQATDAAAAPVPVPEPTHGGVYELVAGQLVAIEGGPPKPETPADDAAASATPGEGA
jgi:hypothetical protein